MISPDSKKPHGEPGTSRGRRRRLLHQALKYSFLEGAFSVVMFALLQTFAIPAIMALGAGEIGVANLTGFSALLAGLSQLAAPRLAALAPSRRMVVVLCVRLQAASCLLFAGAGFLREPLAVPAAIAAYAFYGVTGSVGSSPWASWMSDLIPAGIRGRYFAWRGLWLGLVHGAVALSTGVVLRAAQRGGKTAPWEAFAAVFAAAAIFRVVSARFLNMQYEPAPAEIIPARDFTYWEFLRKVRESNFTRFVIAFAFFNSAAFVAGAFLPVYLLRDLGFDYRLLAFLSTMSLLSSLVFVRFWGRVSDRYGNRFVLRVCALGIIPIPMIYVFSQSAAVLAVAHAMGGALWSGLGLASFSYVMEATTPKRRIRCYAYMNATIGILIAAFLMVSGEVAVRLPVLFVYPLQSLFLLSSLLRVIPAFVLAFGIRQLTDKPQANAVDLFYELPAIRPTVTLLRNITRPFRRI